jgi:hypothetical protein
VEAFDKAMAASLDKKYSYKNSKWKLNKDYAAEEPDQPTYYDDEDITPEMFAQLSIDDRSSNTSSLSDAEDIKLGYDNYISAKVSIPVNGYQFANGVVKRRARDTNGELIGKSNPNPLLDISVYEAELEDGSVEKYHANILVEHIYNKIDNQGCTTSIFDSIVDHRTDGESLRGQSIGKPTTKGWTMCVKLSNGSTMWVPLSDLKEAQPNKTAEYARAMGLEDQPAFSWWVSRTLRKPGGFLRQ